MLAKSASIEKIPDMAVETGCSRAGLTVRILLGTGFACIRSCKEVPSQASGTICGLVTSGTIART